MYNYIEKQKAYKEKERADKLLIQAEVYICVLAITALATALIFVSTFEFEAWLSAFIIGTSMALFISSMCFALKIEVEAGYYVCKKCKHKFIPKYSEAFWAMHVGWTRYLKCPDCKEKSWCKKVISKNTDI